MKIFRNEMNLENFDHQLEFDMCLPFEYFSKISSFGGVYQLRVTRLYPCKNARMDSHVDKLVFQSLLKNPWTCQINNPYRSSHILQLYWSPLIDYINKFITNSSRVLFPRLFLLKKWKCTSQALVITSIKILPPKYRDIFHPLVKCTHGPKEVNLKVIECHEYCVELD